MEPTEDGCCTGDSPQTWSFCSQYESEVDCERTEDCEWINFMDPEECVQPTDEPTLEPTLQPTEPGCCNALQTFGGSKAPYYFCISLLTEFECDRAAESCEWLVTEDPSDCLPPSNEPTVEPTPGPSYTEEGCCKGNSTQSNTFCSGFAAGESCETAAVCTWISDEEECADTTETPSVEPTASPSEWIDGCCTGIEMIDDSFCSQFFDGPSCEANPQCWWIDGGMRFPRFGSENVDLKTIRRDADGVNITETPTDSPVPIPSSAPSEHPTQCVPITSKLLFYSETKTNSQFSATSLCIFVFMVITPDFQHISAFPLNRLLCRRTIQRVLLSRDAVLDRLHKLPHFAKYSSMNEIVSLQVFATG